jgi:hypothetical protein
MSGQATIDERTYVEPLYFGCWRQIGHGFHRVGGEHVFGKHTPWGYGVEDLTPKTCSCQGQSALWQKGGWTALAVHDYTVDHRGNSKSVFCFPELIATIDAAWQRARETFPEIVARLDRANGDRDV